MSAAQPPASHTAPAELALEAALVARLLGSARLPAGLLLWFARAPHALPCPGDDSQHLCDPQLCALLDELIVPLSTRPAMSPVPQARSAAQWLAVACRYASQQSSRLQLNIGPRLLAACLLPLYRCLGTDDLSQGLQQTQMRLGETLALLALCAEVGPALVEVLDTPNTPLESPHAILASHFHLSLPLLARLLAETTADYHFSEHRFSPAARKRLQAFDAARSQLTIPAWAAPELLWNLAAELTSEKSELKLPRSWIDISLPWNQIAVHWHNMLQLLDSPAQPASALSHSDAPPNLASAMENEHLDAVDEHSTLATVNEIAAIIAGKRLAANTASNTASNTAANTAANALPPQPDTAVDATAEHIDSVQSRTPSVFWQQPASTDRGAARSKVPISEILTHDDPSFVNVVRRQIGKCRSEDRALSLAALVVLPEDANHRFAVYDNGLNLWQQKLVSWLIEHPQVVEPHAFLTSHGELLLCILDLERNETTALLRHGLVEVLTGQHFDESQGSLLGEIDAPARYHAGIASTSSPGARFLPEQLIEPAMRCLAAARRHGKASIKSIEVY